MRNENRESIISFIIALDNTEDNDNKKFKASAKKSILIVLFLTWLPLMGAIARKETAIACTCTFILLLVCLFFYIEGRWFVLQLKNDNNVSILIHRISILIGTILSWTISFLYVIILITCDRNNACFPLLLVSIMTISAIPAGVFRANYVIKKKGGIENRWPIKAPPFWAAVIIASFFSRLTHDGVIFSITVLLCVINFYTLYSTLIPNVVRLYYVKKYGLEDEIPVIFEI